jgi:hypothetical protein
VSDPPSRWTDAERERAEDFAALRVISHLPTKQQPQAFSPLGRRVALLVERWVGVHHVDASRLARVEWSNPIHMTLACPNYVGDLSTYDSDYLTRLVLLAHDLCVRVGIEPRGPKCVSLSFTPRTREDGFARHHPRIEDVVTEWRARHAEVVT